MTGEPSLNSQQQAAVRHPGGPMCIVAGAGTGKTQTLMQRFLYLVESGVRKDRILCLTFSRKAAQELRRRILHELEHGHGTLHISTFHAFCLDLLRHWNQTTQPQPVHVLAGPELTQFVLRVVDAIPDDQLKAHHGVFGREKLVSNVLTFGSQTRDLLMCPEEIDAYVQRVEPVPGRLHDLALAHRRVAEALAAEGVYDFAALAAEVIRRLHTEPDLLTRTRSRFDHILIDEFQDTNFAQFELIRLLANEAGNVCVVGDANQAIYAFRGGQSRYIEEFELTFPGAVTYSLGTNYRSGQAILDPANTLIRHNPGSDFITLTASDPNRAGLVTLTQAANPALEAAHIARQIREITRRADNPVRFEDIAILLRSTERNSAPIEQALAANGIPFRSRDESQGNAESIRDVLAALRLVCGLAMWRDAARLVSKRDRELAQVLRSIEAAVPDPDDLNALLDRTTDIAALPQNQQRALREMQRTAAMARQFGDREIPAALYHAMLLAGVLSEDTDAITTSTMKAFIDRAHVLADAGGTLAELSEQLTAGYDTVPWTPPAQGNGVTLITVHSAKGLEWPVVFLPAMVDGEFPLPMKLDADFDSETLSEWSSREGELPSEQERRSRFLNEERRLAYVAMTRAQSELHISYPARNRESVETRASQFILEAGLTGLLSVAGRAMDELPPTSRAELARQLRSRRTSAMVTDIRDGQLPVRLAGLLVDQAAAASGWAGAKPLRHRLLPAPYGPEQSIPLSYSRINVYENCPRQYFYATSLGLQQTDESVHMTFGSVIHAVLDDLNRSWQATGRIPATEDIERAIDVRWPPRGFQFAAQTRQLRARASAILQRYFHSERQRTPARRPILVESQFRAEYGKHSIAGRIDVVLVDNDGNAEIVDFKTSKWNSESVKNPSQSLQLFIYDHAYRLANPNAQPSVAFYALRHNKDRAYHNEADWHDRQICGHQHDDESRQGLTDRLNALIIGLESNDFEPRPANNVCNRCAYRWLCPAGAVA